MLPAARLTVPGSVGQVNLPIVKSIIWSWAEAARTVDCTAKKVKTRTTPKRTKRFMAESPFMLWMNLSPLVEFEPGVRRERLWTQEWERVIAERSSYRASIPADELVRHGPHMVCHSRQRHGRYLTFVALAFSTDECR